MTPQRIQLSRAKGFNLQAVSMALNGLPAVKVDRTTRWGNHIVVGSERGIGHRPWTAEDAVAQYRSDIEWEMEPHRADGNEPLDLSPLRAKNLACWCRHGAACHADVLLQLANRPSREGSP